MTELIVLLGIIFLAIAAGTVSMALSEDGRSAGGFLLGTLIALLGLAVLIGVIVLLGPVLGLPVWLILLYFAGCCLAGVIGVIITEKGYMFWVGFFIGIIPAIIVGVIIRVAENSAKKSYNQ